MWPKKGLCEESMQYYLAFKGSAACQREEPHEVVEEARHASL